MSSEEVLGDEGDHIDQQTQLINELSRLVLYIFSVVVVVF